MLSEMKKVEEKKVFGRAEFPTLEEEDAIEAEKNPEGYIRVEDLPDIEGLTPEEQLLARERLAEKHQGFVRTKKSLLEVSAAQKEVAAERASRRLAEGAVNLQGATPVGSGEKIGLRKAVKAIGSEYLHRRRNERPDGYKDKRKGKAA